MNKIGLSMIVKNESKIIKRCLDSVKPIIDYVCIHDTGSSDDTVKIIKEWLKENKILGEVKKETWKNFAFNRTSALKNIRKKRDIDYVLIIDADEILQYEENFDVLKFKNSLNFDLYYIKCKFSNIEYQRTSLFKNSKKFFYKGVLHEYLESEEQFLSKTVIDGFYNVPIQDSFRNNNKEKYKNDAKILEEAIEKETDNQLIRRYTFYLAQSYKDCEQNEKAIYWYNKRVDLSGWEQEIYWSLYQIACLKEMMGYPEDDIIQSYLRAYEKCTSRIEALHGAIRFCRIHQRYHQAYIIGKYAKTLTVDKTGLFVESWVWDYGLDDEFSIACYWTMHYQEGLDLCLKILDKVPDNQKERIQKNLDFFKEKLFKKSLSV